jgi:outer membrane protein OmpA-like peptidoglycan-associated protein
VRFRPTANIALRGRVANLRREVQMVFGASLLGVVTASCVSDPHGASALTPDTVSRAKEGAEHPPIAQENAERAARPGDGAADSSRSRADAPSASAMVAIYGGSSVAIHDEVKYARDSLVIDAEGERTLAALKEALDEFDCDILIQGHASRDEANAAEWLSRRRAELVRQRLLALGVDARRLSIEGRGASPLSATTPRVLDRDRRVSFLFHAGGSNGHRSCDESDRRKP